jgi:hypothetical protein
MVGYNELASAPAPLSRFTDEGSSDVEETTAPIISVSFISICQLTFIGIGS